jgi:hypothetical protein
MPVVPFPLSPQLHYHHQLPVMLFVEIALRFPAPFLGLQINLHGEPMDQLIPGAQKGRPALPPGGARTPPSHHRASLAHSFFQLDWGSGNLLLRSQPFEKVLGLLKEKDIPPELSHTNPTPNPAAKYLTSVQIDAKIPSS